MKSVILNGVSKQFSGKTVLDNLNLKVPAGTFFVLLGPSGCGKTTILRIIAGLENVDSGTVCLGEQDITAMPAFKRKINTVFQGQALFPHMTVFENIAYGLEIRGIAAISLEKKVSQVIASMGLLGLEKKYPTALSGGQKQRVALARAIVVKPDVLLFDEPLSALDMRLKDRMLMECVQLQNELQTTFVYITHDQKEALVAADIIAVMNLDGKIEQIGTPKEIYEKPKTKFIANFVGNSTIFEGVLLSIKEGLGAIAIPDVGTVVAKVDSIENWMIPGMSLFLGVKPERVVISKEKKEKYDNCISGTLINSMYAGKYTQYAVKTTNDQEIIVFQSDEKITESNICEGDAVFLQFKSQHVVLLED